MNCEKCNREMETSLIDENNEGTRVYWHKDGTPDDCQNRVLVAVCKERNELGVKYHKAIEGLKSISNACNDPSQGGIKFIADHCLKELGIK